MFNQLESMFKMYDVDYGITAIKNNTYEIRFFFMEIKDNTYLDRKYICSLSGLIKQGDLISTLGEKWLVVQEDVQISKTYSRFIGIRIHNQINFGIDGFLYSTYGLISTGSQGVNSNQYMSTPEGKMILTVQKNDMTSKIKISDRVIKFGSAWIVVSVTNEILGLLNITVDKVSIQSNESIIGEVPNTVSQWTLSLEELPTAKLGISLDLHYVVTKNGSPVSSGFNITWTSSDNSIASVLNGVLTTHSVGTASISGMIDNTVISDSISVEVNNVDTIEYTVTPINRALREGLPQTCIVNKFVNGVLTPDTYTFTSSGVVESYYTLITMSGDSFKVTNIYGYTSSVLSVKAVASNGDEIITDFTFRSFM